MKGVLKCVRGYGRYIAHSRASLATAEGKPIHLPDDSNYLAFIIGIA
jgi:hypothetical protein